MLRYLTCKLLLFSLFITGLNAGIHIKRPNFNSKFDIDLYYGNREGFIVVDSEGVWNVNKAFISPFLRNIREKDLIHFIVFGSGYLEVDRLMDGGYTIESQQRLDGGVIWVSAAIGTAVLTAASLWKRRERRKLERRANEEREALVKEVGSFAGDWAGGAVNVAAGEVRDFVRRYTVNHAIKVVDRFEEGVRLSEESRKELHKVLSLELNRHGGFEHVGTAREIAPAETRMVRTDGGEKFEFFDSLRNRRPIEITPSNELEGVDFEVPLTMDTNITTPQDAITREDLIEIDSRPELSLLMDTNITTAQDSLELPPEPAPRRRKIDASYLSMDTVEGINEKVVPEDKHSFLGRVSSRSERIENSDIDELITMERNFNQSIRAHESGVITEHFHTNEEDEPRYSIPENLARNGSLELSSDGFGIGIRPDFEGMANGGNGILSAIEFFLKFSSRF